MLVVIPGLWPSSLEPRSQGVVDVQLQFLRSVRLSLGLLAWAVPANCTGAWGLRPAWLSTVSQKYYMISELIVQDWVLWCLAGPKYISVVSPPTGELLKAVLMPLTCMQRPGKMCRRQKGLTLIVVTLAWWSKSVISSLECSMLTGLWQS